MNQKFQHIYLDNNATTQVDPGVVDVMLPFFSEHYGNPSSVHGLGLRVKRELERAREQVADFLGCQSGEIIFTSCGTESNHLAIRGALQANPKKKHLIVTQVEHPSVLRLCDQLEKEAVEITRLSVDSKGCLDLQRLEAEIRGDTALISIMWGNNETGMIFPVETIGALAHKHQVPFHTDAVQCAGKIPIDFSALPIDFLSVSGHKFHGPKGTGVLLVRRGKRIKPMLLGGSQENKRRAGTENTASLIGLGKACYLAAENLSKMKEISVLRDHLEQSLFKEISAVPSSGNLETRLPNTSNVSFEAVDGEAVLMHLSELGIYASSGSACSSGSTDPSHVLLALGLTDSEARGAIRFSLSRFTKQEDVDRVIEVLPGVIEKLRTISPHWKA